MKKRQYIILAVVFGVIALIVSSIVGNGRKSADVKQKRSKTKTYVQTATAQNGSHELRILGNGRIASARDLSITAEVQGKLLAGNIELRGGSHFKAGQVLCTIDDNEVQLNMQARKSGFLTLLATAIPDLKLDYPESYKKWETFFEGIDVAKKLPTLPEIGSVQEKTYLASRNILSEYYNIQADEERLKRYRITAPFDGTIVNVTTPVGSVVNPGTLIARVIQTANLEVEVSIPINESHLVQLGDQVKVWSQDQKINRVGKILRIGKFVNQNTQSVDVFIGLDLEDEAHIYDGMYVEVEFGIGQMDSVLQVPRKALVQKNNVFVVEDTILILKPVSVAFTDHEYAYIRGVENGTQVVVEALSNPTDSMIVHRLEANE